LAAARRVIDDRLDVLVRLCWAQGVDRVRLAHALGVSRSALYRRFGPDDGRRHGLGEGPGAAGTTTTLGAA